MNEVYLLFISEAIETGLKSRTNTLHRAPVCRILARALQHDYSQCRQLTRMGSWNYFDLRNPYSIDSTPALSELEPTALQP